MGFSPTSASKQLFLHLLSSIFLGGGNKLQKVGSCKFRPVNLYESLNKRNENASARLPCGANRNP